jgi:hypothetical protein
LRGPDRKDISAKTALRWRDEIETVKSQIGAEVFKALKAQRADEAPLADLEQAKAIGE